MPINEIANIIASIPTELVVGGVAGKKLYDDLASPTVKEAGALGAKVFVALFSSAYSWAENRKKRFESLQNDVLDNLKDVPDEEIVDVAPEHIIAPAMNAYSYSLNNDELRKMYSNLISKALLKEETNSIHPALVNILQNLHPMECVFLKYLSLDTKQPIPTIQTLWNFPDNSGSMVSLTNVYQYPTSFLTRNAGESILISTQSNVIVGNPSFLSNLSRLGLITLKYDEFLIKEDAYSSLLSLEAVIKDRADCESCNRNFDVKRGIVKLTPLGCDLIRICI